MEDCPYLGYSNEDDYHAHYTLAAMLERETSSTKRKRLRADISAIEARCKTLREKHREI